MCVLFVIKYLSYELVHLIVITIFVIHMRIYHYLSQIIAILIKTLFIEWLDVYSE
jgi:hypothetical protein